MRPLSEFDPAWPHGHVQKSGNPARIVSRLNNSDYAFAVVLHDGDGVEYVSTYTAEGRYLSGGQGLRDLVNAPAPKKRVQGWVNVWGHDNRGFELGRVFETKAQALAAAGFTERRLACVFIDVEEGEGLS